MNCYSRHDPGPMVLRCKEVLNCVYIDDAHYDTLIIYLLNINKKKIVT